MLLIACCWARRWSSRSLCRKMYSAFTPGTAWFISHRASNSETPAGVAKVRNVCRRSLPHFAETSRCPSVRPDEYSERGDERSPRSLYSLARHGSRGQRNRSELVGALGEQLFNFVRRHPDGELQRFIDVDVVLRNVLRCVAKHGADGQLREAEVTCNTAEGVPESVRRHSADAGEPADAI